MQFLFALASLLHLATSSRVHQKRPLELAAPLHAVSNTSSPLDVIQVNKPISIPKSSKCNVKQTLMQHTFASSYGVPYVDNYTPPTCDFNSVIIKWSVTIAGRQFDRLAEMYLGDVEVWRTSTAEPTASGIAFSYEKDLSMYLSLWKSPQTIIFSLNNVYDSTYTGAFNTTLTATFSYDEAEPAHADLILPISAELGSSEQPSIFTLPGDNATVQQILPSNVSHAVVSIGATGQSNEEFWYTNVLQSGADVFGPGSLIGYGPFREVQLWIDDMLAGVAWPFPVIFTGGIAPGFWKPIVGIDAYDLREYEIDITPFLPYLLDGKAHSFSIKVVGVDDNGGNGAATLSETSINSYWLVDGKIFLFYGEDDYNGTYAAPSISTYPILQTTSTITTSSNGTNLTYAYGVSAKRTYTAKSNFGSWTQSLEYSNNGFVSDCGLYQFNTQNTKGSSAAVDKSAPAFSNTLSYSYSISVNTTYTESGSDLTIAATLDRGLEISSSGRPDLSTYTLVYGPMNLETTQIGNAYYSNAANNSYSYGDMDQTFSETSYGSSFSRHVKSHNLTIVYDKTY